MRAFASLPSLKEPTEQCPPSKSSIHLLGAADEGGKFDVEARRVLEEGRVADPLIDRELGAGSLRFATVPYANSAYLFAGTSAPAGLYGCDEGRWRAARGRRPGAWPGGEAEIVRRDYHHLAHRPLEGAVVISRVKAGVVARHYQCLLARGPMEVSEGVAP